MDVRVFWGTLIICACCTVAFAQGGVRMQGNRAIIELGGSGGDPRAPVAVPYFASVPGLEAYAKEMAETIAYDLDFTGEFVLLSPSKFPPDFTGFTGDPTQINFTSWQGTGADYLVYALITNEGGGLVGEFRLFEVATGNQILGKRIAGKPELRRLVAHQFSDEITKQVTGTPGIATSRIAFSSGTTGKKEIYIADYDGANVKQLTNHGSVSIMPVMSPDGTKIAYLSYKDRYPWLYILDIESGAVRPLSRHVGVNIAPAWSPDSKSLAIVLSKDGNQEIYRINADGTGERRLTNSKGVDTSPTFSPDGGQIAFVSERGGFPQIWVMGADGSNQRRLSMVRGKAFDPAWSPDGSMIAFVIEGGGSHIAVMDASGAGVRTLTSAGTNEQPTWSPDSRHIMFHRTQGVQIRAVDVFLSDPRDRAIPFLKMQAQGPTWGPRR